MARAQGANVVAALAFEDEYGEVATSGFYKIAIGSSELGDDEQLLESDLLGMGREDLRPDRGPIDNNGSMVVPLCHRQIGLFLKLLLGEPTTTGAAAPFTHTFVSGAQDVPSATIYLGNPEVPAHGRNYGSKVNSMTIGMQRNGLLSATLAMIAQGEDETGGPLSGTVTELPIERFAQASGGVERNGVLLGGLVSASLVMSNNMQALDDIRPDKRIGGADVGKFTVGLELTIRYADNTLRQQAENGEACDLVVGWAISANKTLEFRMPQVDLPKPKRRITGPGGIQITYPTIATRPAVGRQLTAILVNDVEEYA